MYTFCIRLLAKGTDQFAFAPGNDAMEAKLMKARGYDGSITERLQTN
jgi:hypothetical protein